METFRIFRRTPLFAKPDPFSDSLGDVEVNTAFISPATVAVTAGPAPL